MISLTLNEVFAPGGPNLEALVTAALDNSYPTGGYTIDPIKVGLSKIKAAYTIGNDQNYIYAYNAATGKLMLLTASGGAGGNTGNASGGTPAGTNGTSAVSGTGAGTADAQVFTGALPPASVNLAFPAFTGTGFTTAGQVVTTTDNQTMGVDQCAGMWLIADALTSTAPVLIVSNTAVTGAPAVLTVIGTAPATDAGTYRIVSGFAPGGTNAPSAVTVSSLSGTAAAQVFTGTPLADHLHTIAAGGGGIAEVANATDVSAVTALKLIFIGQ